MKVLSYVLKIILPMVTLVGISGGAYYKYYISPKIDDRLKPIMILILENNILLNKIAPDSVKIQVREEMKPYSKAFGFIYPDSP